MRIASYNLRNEASYLVNQLTGNADISGFEVNYSIKCSYR